MTTVYTGVPARGFAAKARALGPPLGAVAGIGVCCAAVWLADPTTPGGPSPVCPTKLLFGIDCPGCGGLRMMYSLLHGDFLAALHYNAVALVVVLLFGWSITAWALGRLRGRAMASWLHWRHTGRIFMVVFAVWFLVRNLPFAPFTSLFV